MKELVIHDNKQSSNIMPPQQTIRLSMQNDFWVETAEIFLSNDNNHHEIMVFNGVHKQSTQSKTVYFC
jgi:hypothetical protein